MNIKNILLGITIGDAFGAGVEFQDRDWIRKNVDFSCFVNVRHSIQVDKEKLKPFIENYHPWDYTDDTEMTIGLIKALVSPNPFDEKYLLEAFKNEYQKGKLEKGYGRNGHGSIAWFYNGKMTIKAVRDFQRNRPNPGNAPAMRSVPLGLVKEHLINDYARINANTTHPNINAVLSSQLIARAARFFLVERGSKEELISYCLDTISLNEEYISYLLAVDKLNSYDSLTEKGFDVLCGAQPIQKPYFLPGIKGLPSDSKYTAGAVLYVLKNADNTFDALRKSVLLGGDVDSVASITTGIMAGVYGLSSIPDFMIENVEGRTYIEELSKIFENYINQL